MAEANLAWMLEMSLWVEIGGDFTSMMLHGCLGIRNSVRRRPAYWKFRMKTLIFLCLVLVSGLFVGFAPSVRAAPSDLKVHAQAPGFARLDTAGVQDPSGWFYQAVLYNPTSSDMLVTGLRFWYNASVKIIDTGKPPFDARCYDTRYFSALPLTLLVSDREIGWEYAPGSISITVPGWKMVLTWIEVPTKSVDNAENIPATYNVQAFTGGQWVSSPVYQSHGGANNAVSAVFRMDLNLSSDPFSELQTHPNPQWLFNENRSMVKQETTRVRLVPVASGKGLGIDSANVNITLPTGWNYVLGSAWNPYGESISYLTVGGRDRLSWLLDHDVSVYSTNQSLAQNYVEFNVTASATMGMCNFTVDSRITSLGGRTTTENQFVYMIVQTPPVADFVFSPLRPLVSESATFNGSSSYDLDGAIVDHFWDFGDGYFQSGAIAVHAYSQVGNYTVILNVIDNDGLWDAEIKTIEVRDTPSVYFIYFPVLPLMDQSVDFNASLSEPNGGYITGYLWDFGDGGAGSGVVVSHTYTAFGNYTVVLTVTDSEDLNGTYTKVIRIGASPNAVFTYSPEQPWLLSTVTFNASLSLDSDGLVTAYEWDFGDGNATTVYSPIASHFYHASGNFTVVLTVYDDDGFSGLSSTTLTVVVHNVAITGVLPSATEIRVGNQLNVSVVLENKGTVRETFDVVLYYNNTVIGTTRVTDLLPGAEVTLIFHWDTTGLTEGTVSIRAETSQILGEADVTDNSLSYGNIRIASASDPWSFWRGVLTYVIPVGAVLGAVLAIVGLTVLRKSASQVGDLPAGGTPSECQQPLTDVMGAELPDAYSVMILGDAGSGKSVLCQQLTQSYLNQGKPCVYVTYDCFPDEIRDNMKGFGWDLSMYEKDATFAFVDCYSPAAGKDSQERHSVKQPFALHELGTEISSALGEMKQGSPRIFLDSTVPLFTRLEPANVVEFLQDRSAMVKGENGVFLFTIGRGTIPQDLQRRLEELVDCIIDLQIVEQKGETARRLRIRKLRGRSFSEQWVSFRIDMKKGFVVSGSRH